MNIFDNNELQTPADLIGKKAGQVNNQTAEANEHIPLSPNQGGVRTTNNLNQIFQEMQEDTAAATAALNAPEAEAAQATQVPPVVDPSENPLQETAAATAAATAAQDAPETEAAQATQGPPAANPTEPAGATLAQDAPATPGAPAIQGAVGTLETTPDLEPTAAQSLQTVHDIVRGIDLLATRNPPFLMDSTKTNPRIEYVQETLTPLSWAIVKSWEINPEAPQIFLLAIHSLNLELIALCLSAGLSYQVSGIINPVSWDNLGTDPVKCVSGLDLCSKLKAQAKPGLKNRIGRIEKLLIEDEDGSARKRILEAAGLNEVEPLRELDVAETALYFYKPVNWQAGRELAQTLKWQRQRAEEAKRVKEVEERKRQRLEKGLQRLREHQSWTDDFINTASAYEEYEKQFASLLARDDAPFKTATEFVELDLALQKVVNDKGINFEFDANAMRDLLSIIGDEKFSKKRYNASVKAQAQAESIVVSKNDDDDSDDGGDTLVPFRGVDTDAPAAAATTAAEAVDADADGIIVADGNTNAGGDAAREREHAADFGDNRRHARHVDYNPHYNFKQIPLRKFCQRAVDPRQEKRKAKTTTSACGSIIRVSFGTDEEKKKMTVAHLGPFPHRVAILSDSRDEGSAVIRFQPPFGDAPVQASRIGLVPRGVSFDLVCKTGKKMDLTVIRYDGGDQEEEEEEEEEDEMKDDDEDDAGANAQPPRVGALAAIERPARQGTNGGGGIPPAAIQATRGLPSPAAPAEQRTQTNALLAAIERPARQGTNGGGGPPPAAIQATRGLPSPAAPAEQRTQTNALLAAIERPARQGTNGGGGIPPAAIQATRGLPSPAAPAEQRTQTNALLAAIERPARQGTNGGGGPPPAAIQATRGLPSPAAPAEQRTQTNALLAAIERPARQGTNGGGGIPPAAIQATRGLPSPAAPAEQRTQTNALLAAIERPARQGTNGGGGPPPAAIQATRGLPSPAAPAEQRTQTNALLAAIERPARQGTNGGGGPPPPAVNTGGLARSPPLAANQAAKRKNPGDSSEDSPESSSDDDTMTLGQAAKKAAKKRKLTK
jgi:hypothetical protein